MGASDAEMGQIAGCKGRFEAKIEGRWKTVALEEIEPGSVAFIFGRQDSLKTSGYSRCQVGEGPQRSSTIGVCVGFVRGARSICRG